MKLKKKKKLKNDSERKKGINVEKKRDYFEIANNGEREGH